jgi:hypothetical protein
VSLTCSGALVKILRQESLRHKSLRRYKVIVKRIKEASDDSICKYFRMKLLAAQASLATLRVKKRGGL